MWIKSWYKSIKKWLEGSKWEECDYDLILVDGDRIDELLEIRGDEFWVLKF
jgi:hypothetical protein